MTQRTRTSSPRRMDEARFKSRREDGSSPLSSLPLLLAPCGWLAEDTRCSSCLTIAAACATGGKWLSGRSGAGLRGGRVAGCGGGRSGSEDRNRRCAQRRPTRADGLGSGDPAGGYAGASPAGGRASVRVWPSRGRDAALGCGLADHLHTSAVAVRIRASGGYCLRRRSLRHSSSYAVNSKGCWGLPAYPCSSGVIVESAFRTSC